MKHLLLALIFFFPVLLLAQTPDSVAVAREVDSLIQVCQDYITQQDFEAAMQTVAVAKEKAEADLGKTSKGYANCVHTQGGIQIKLGNYAEAEPICIEAVDLREKLLGKEDPDYASSLNNLATLYRETGQYDSAEQFALRAKDIRGKTPGKQSPEYASTLNLLGILYYNLGDYDKAESYYLEAKDIREKTPGKESPEYAMTLDNLAVLYSDIGLYNQAEELYLEASHIREKTPGKASIDYAASMNNLATFYYETGQYSRAEQSFLNAKSVFANVLGEDHEYYGATLNNLAALYWELGQYSNAESLLLEAKDIREKTLGKGNQHYAASLNNLAGLYVETGQYNKAEPLYLEAKSIFEKVLGNDHADYAVPVENLATLYYEKGDYAKAEPLFLEAKEIRLKSLGKDHPDYASSLNNLAQLYSNIKQYEKAKPLFIEAKDIWVNTSGKEHPNYAASLENLAILYYENGDYTQAESFYKEARDIGLKLFGKEHHDYVNTLYNLGNLYQATSQISESAELLCEMNEIIRLLIEKYASYASEKQTLAYLQKFEKHTARFQSFSHSHPSPELLRASFDNALFYKGYLLENARHLARAIAGADSLTRDLFDRWQGCKRRLANEYTKPIAERRFIAETEAEAEAYEKTLARKLPVFGDTRRVPRWQDVRARLHPGEAAIEFIHYPYYDPEATDSILYAALVLLPGDTCPHYVPLCEQHQLDTLLRIKYPDKRYEYLSEGHSLYRLLWQPLEPLLSGVGTVYYAPVGALHTINPDAIAINLRGDSTLIDRYKLVRLGSTRQLAAPVMAKKSGNDALLFGGIRYESDSMAIQQENSRNGAATRGFNNENLSPSFDSLLPFEPLTGAKTEVEFVRQLMTQKKFNTRLFTGFGASEEAFKQFADSMTISGASARVLHLATHGYFFPDPDNNESQQNRGFDNEPVFKISEHPFLRSGLVLAGANHAWQTGKPIKADMEDGILTAYEISSMSLPNSELVVLSACETGLGDLSGNEGVYGLQRAFKIAGVQYLIMSLWDVPDEATKELMSLFYRNWLDKKMDIPTAFRGAQLALKKKNNNPEHWAGFILLQ